MSFDEEWRAIAKSTRIDYKKKNSPENFDNFSQKFSKIRLKRLLLSNFDIEGTIFQKFTEFRIFQT